MLLAVEQTLLAGVSVQESYSTSWLWIRIVVFE